jgi:hypothetical protein
MANTLLYDESVATKRDVAELRREIAELRAAIHRAEWRREMDKGSCAIDQAVRDFKIDTGLMAVVFFIAVVAFRLYYRAELEPWLWRRLNRLGDELFSLVLRCPSVLLSTRSTPPWRP